MRGSHTSRALDELYRRHVGEVYRYAYAMLGNRADAEDVAQTTFMNALRALARGERPRKPSSWLLAIAHNVVRQRFRQAHSRPTEVELTSELAGLAPDDGGGPTIDEMLKALGRIPPLQREAIVMREFEGRSYAEIARILEITTSALETLLFRARRSLAEELEAVVTCELAERAISRRLDARLSRKERRRLEQHLAECPSCARFEHLQRRGRRALKGLALLPVPISLTLFKGAPSATAAAALPTIGAAAAGAGATGAGTAGGAAAGGLAVKAAIAVAAIGVAGGAGYTGLQATRDAGRRPAPPPAEAKSETTKDVGVLESKASDPESAEAPAANLAVTAVRKRAVKTKAASGHVAAKEPRIAKQPREENAGAKKAKRPHAAHLAHSTNKGQEAATGNLAAPRDAQAKELNKQRRKTDPASRALKKPRVRAAEQKPKPTKAEKNEAKGATKVAAGKKAPPGQAKQEQPPGDGQHEQPPGQAKNAQAPDQAKHEQPPVPPAVGGAAGAATDAGPPEDSASPDGGSGKEK
jgi:RNA polymerase sigma factor (sigma-70 family)